LNLTIASVTPYARRISRASHTCRLTKRSADRGLKIHQEKNLDFGTKKGT